MTRLVRAERTYPVFGVFENHWDSHRLRFAEEEGLAAPLEAD
jgi:hypothetical protein